MSQQENRIFREKDAQKEVDEALAAYKAQLPQPPVNRALEAVAKVMGEVGSVEKRGVNKFHDYAYATAADVMHAIQPLMAKNGLTIIQHQKALEFIQDGAAMAIAYEFHVIHQSGDSLPLAAVHTGVAAAKTKNGSPDDKAANKCHTAARKYFLLSLFQIPTGDYDDPDADGDIPAKAPANTKEAVKQEITKVQEKSGKTILLNLASGEAKPFMSMSAYLDALDTELANADDPVQLFDLNSATLGEMQAKAVAAKNKQGDAIAQRITEVYDRIRALDIPYDPLKGA